METTIKGTPIAGALPAMATMSKICNGRLETDLQKNAHVFSSTAFANAYGSEQSTNCTWIPNVGRVS